MALRHNIVTVTTSPVSLMTGMLITSNRREATLVIQNDSVGTVYIGESDVSTTDFGHMITPGGALVLCVRPGDVPYAVAASTVSLHVLYLGVN